MAQYGNFFDAYMAQQRKPTPAQSTWTQPNASGLSGQQQLANAYSSLNSTWQPDPSYGVTVNPVKFDPYGDVGYGATASALSNIGTHAQASHDYQGHNIGQTTGYDSSGNLITSGEDLNPYAQAAILKRNYDNSVRGTTNSYAANGQLYAGSLNNAQATNDWGYAVGSDQLKRSARNSYNSNDTSLQGTLDSGQLQLAQQLGPAFAAFLASQGGN